MQPDFYPMDCFKIIANAAVFWTRYDDPDRWTKQDLQRFLDLLEENWRGLEGNA